MNTSAYRGDFVLTETKDWRTATIASCNSRELLEELKMQLQLKADRNRLATSLYAINHSNISL